MEVSSTQEVTRKLAPGRKQVMMRGSEGGGAAVVELAQRLDLEGDRALPRVVDVPRPAVDEAALRLRVVPELPVGAGIAHGLCLLAGEHGRVRQEALAVAERRDGFGHEPDRRTHGKGESGAVVAAARSISRP